MQALTILKFHPPFIGGLGVWQRFSYHYNRCYIIVFDYQQIYAIFGLNFGKKRVFFNKPIVHRPSLLEVSDYRVCSWQPCWLNKRNFFPWEISFIVKQEYCIVSATNMAAVNTLCCSSQCEISCYKMRSMYCITEYDLKFFD